MIREKLRPVSSGWGIFGVLLAIDLAALFGIYLSVEANNPAGIMTSIVVAVLAALMYPGLFIVNPNEGKVLQLFGDYKGTVKDAGLRWANPFYTKKRVSLRVRNFESAQAQGQRHRRQPDRDRRGRRVAGGRHRGGGVRGGRLRELRAGADASRRVRNLATSYPYDAHDEEHVVAARPHRRGRRAPEARDPGPAGEGRRRGDRGAHQPPRLRAGDRRGDAAAAAGRRDHRRAPADRRRRGRHGGDGARHALASARSSSSTRSARRRWSATCWWCCAAIATPSRSSTRAPSTSDGSWPNGNPSCCASTATCSTRSSAGRTTICAA